MLSELSLDWVVYNLSWNFKGKQIGYPSYHSMDDKEGSYVYYAHYVLVTICKLACDGQYER